MQAVLLACAMIYRRPKSGLFVGLVIAIPISPEFIRPARRVDFVEHDADVGARADVAQGLLDSAAARFPGFDDKYDLPDMERQHRRFGAGEHRWRIKDDDAVAVARRDVLHQR